MPLCTILAKWPAPERPTYAYPDSRSKVREHGLNFLICHLLASRHQAKPVFQTPHTAADTDIQKPQSLRLEIGGASN